MEREVGVRAAQPRPRRRRTSPASLPRAWPRSASSDQRATNPYDLDLSRRKLVALAGVLAMEPPVLVLDEPTTGQDADGRRAGRGGRRRVSMRQAERSSRSPTTWSSRRPISGGSSSCATGRSSPTGRRPRSCSAGQPRPPRLDRADAAARGEDRRPARDWIYGRWTPPACSPRSGADRTGRAARPYRALRPVRDGTATRSWRRRRSCDAHPARHRRLGTGLPNRRTGRVSPARGRVRLVSVAPSRSEILGVPWGRRSRRMGPPSRRRSSDPSRGARRRRREIGCARPDLSGGDAPPPRAGWQHDRR